MNTPTVTEAMRAGRRALDGLPGVVLIDDWQWCPAFSRWSLPVRLMIDRRSEFVPESTDWCFVVEPTYPLGRIAVHPAKEDSVEATFPHQRINLPGDHDSRWRNGNICVTTEARSLSRVVLNHEPWTASRRLKWYVQRTQSWLEAAASDQLMVDGDPFELPDFPLRSQLEIRIAFKEDQQSFQVWQDIPDRVGLFSYSEFAAIRESVLVQCFMSRKGKVLFDVPWGTPYKTSTSADSRGVWLRLPFLPIISPWQAPATWGELIAACNEHGYAFLPLLEKASHLVRDGKHHLALLGFPVAGTVGNEPSQMHWQALMLPSLTHGGESRNGFRPTKDNQWRLDRKRSFAAEQPIEWLPSANWGPAEISARGRFPTAVCQAGVAMIGAGALGSVIAELLVRAGIQKMAIVDRDAIAMGNLVRHTLTMSDLGQPKADALADRLRRVSPNVHVDAHNTSLPPQDVPTHELLHPFQVIVDSTGSDEVIEALSTVAWPEPKLIVSVSLNLGATRTYVFATREGTFPAERFHRLVDPLLEQDAAAWAAKGLPWEGTGCWDPVTPARIDDVWLLAAAAVKEIESLIMAPPDRDRFCMFEEDRGEDGFRGLQRIIKEPAV